MAEKTVEMADRLRAKKAAELVDLYIQIRDRIADESKAFKARVAGMQALQGQIEAVLIERMDAEGEQSRSTDMGTAFFQNATYCGVDDWEKALAYVLESGQYQFLNHSISKSAVAEYMEENEGEVPPGVKWTEERVLQVRRK